ncbi:MAG: dihydrolipoyl dehydrogenase [Sedimentisphaerales bacterium]|nr:dihydrolipoyl dehydrogenase [Sedimentisphaerales bacterium]
MPETYDVVIIGSGPGGYFTAIRCAQKGLSTAIVEKGEIGGVCLNRGCIPSKTLLASAETFLKVKNADALGIDVAGVSPNWVKIQRRKESIVAGFRKGLAGLIGANKIKIFEGVGTCASAKTVVIENSKGQNEINAGKAVVIATGSVPVEIPAFAFDGEIIISSTEALNLPDIPASMVVVGGGIIGCELACVYSGVGAKVTIVEALEHIINTEDSWVGQLMERELRRHGIEILAGQKVTAVEKAGNSAKVVLQSGRHIDAEKVLVAVGRKATCDKKTIDNLKLHTSGPAIKVDDKMRTNVEGVYALGDVVGTTYLAHGAFAEAEVVAENIAGGNARIGDYSLIPRAVYTFPEIASVGKNEQACAKAGLHVTIGRGFFKANGRSVAHNETTGEIRVVREKATDKILGVTMVGANVTELIAGARLLIGSTEKFNDVSFPHPTVSEALKEAWEDAFGLSVHQPPRKSS